MILNKPSTTKVNILGTEYTVIVEKEDANPDMYKENSGWMDPTVKEIHIGIKTPCYDDYDNLIYDRKIIVRHEIIHAFLFESGLAQNSNECESWAFNEEMIDWFARQFHKIENVYKELKV